MKNYSLRSFANNNSVLFLSIIFISVLAGIYFRIKGLGKWPFALDEYYIFSSIQFIFERGIPEFESGGYYPRGILYQYITACLVWIGIKAELAARVLPVLLNLAAMPAIYKLGVKISNRSIGLLLILFFTFSLWEIELSRFARMYTFFQTIFIWYFYFLYKYLFENDGKSVKWILSLSIVSIFVYEASIFLVALNFLLIFWHYEKRNFRINISTVKNNSIIAVLSLVIFLFTYFFLAYDFRTLYANNLLPVELADYFNNLPKVGKIRLPMILLSTSPFSISGIIFSLYIIVNSVFGGNHWFRKTTFGSYGKFSVISLLVLSAANLYGLLIIFLIVFVLLEWINYRDLVKGEVKLLLLVLIGNFIAQNIFAIFNAQWHDSISYRLEPNLIGNIKILWKEFLNFPNFYELFVLFRDTYKFHTILAVPILLSGTFLLVISKEKQHSAIKITYSIFILLLIGVTILNTQYFETRYLFFLFPLFYLYLLISIDLVVKKVIKNNLKNVIVFLVGLTFFTVSEDSSANHLFNIDSVEINFRNNMSDKLRDHFYPRWDSRSTAELINKNANKNDIIISDEQISSFYLKRLDYLYRNYTSNDFKIESVESGKKERWTNARLVYKYSELLKILSKDETIKWFIINKTYGIKEFEKKRLFDQLEKFQYYKSYDETTYLYKIPGGISFE